MNQSFLEMSPVFLDSESYFQVLYPMQAHLSWCMNSWINFTEDGDGSGLHWRISLMVVLQVGLLKQCLIHLTQSKRSYRFVFECLAYQNLMKLTVYMNLKQIIFISQECIKRD
jgi:hypothetical protein